MQLFNFWRPYPLLKPKENGWYQCSIRYGDELDQEYVMDLYFYAGENVWKDNRVRRVFEAYKVYKHGRETMEHNRVYEDRLCDRTEQVVAWKKRPRVYRFGRKRG